MPKSRLLLQVAMALSLQAICMPLQLVSLADGRTQVWHQAKLGTVYAYTPAAQVIDRQLDTRSMGEPNSTANLYITINLPSRQS